MRQVPVPPDADHPQPKAHCASQKSRDHLRQPQPAGNDHHGGSGQSGGGVNVGPQNGWNARQQHVPNGSPANSRNRTEEHRNQRRHAVQQCFLRPGNREQRQSRGIQQHDGSRWDSLHEAIEKENDKRAAEGHGGISPIAQCIRGDEADEHIANDPAAQSSCKGQHEQSQQIEIRVHARRCSFNAKQQGSGEIGNVEQVVRFRFHAADCVLYATLPYTDFVPELPDIVVYIEALERRIVGQTLEQVRIVGPLLLRTAQPPIQRVEGKKIRELRRIGKRIAIGLDDDLWLVLHLMIAGRLHWRKKGAPVSRPRGLASFDFANGSLVWTEAGSKKRASLHLVVGEGGLKAVDPGGLEVMEADLPAFAERLRSANHTLKRALTDPRLFSGIGNAYSDEILWEAQLSPLALTQKINDAETARLFNAIRASLMRWTDHLRREAADDFPEKVTAFRDGMAVHGRYKEACPRCGANIQRIRYASNETNYCPNCQTSGRLLADRSLSRLLRADWPRTPEELESLTRK